MTNNIKKGFLKAVITVVIFAIPVLINAFPTLANLTIGGVLVMLLNYLKVIRK